MCMKSERLSIIVYSCKKNSDMWRVFLTLFRKYWGNCPYKLMLVTDDLPIGYGSEEKYKFDEVVVIDSCWSEMILKAIVVAGTPYTMLWMDDYLLCDYVDNQKIESILDKMPDNHAANIRLMESPMIPCEKWKNDAQLGYYRPGTAYSISTQVGIWNVNFLKKNIHPGWSAWDFERKGSIEIKDMEHPYLVALDYAFPYEEAVRRGKWMDNGVRLCKRNNISLGDRKVMTNWELCKIYFKGAILELNPTFVVKVQNTVEKIRRKDK